ncbi:hypothetical protein [Nonomuraea longicatena]|uniref:hypothetical protein n=1 Tax=Nonomuraea longicatena TaxID=83682 RepID=UPI0031D86CAA
MRFLLRSALAGAGVAILLLPVVSWPFYDSAAEHRWVLAILLVPFLLSMPAARLARLPVWPLVGLLAPFAMIAVLLVQPDYDSWISHENIAYAMLVGVPAVTGFVISAVLCNALFGKSPGGKSGPDQAPMVR